MEKLAETKGDRRSRILDRARTLMSAQGFDGLSLRKLAAASDVTVPTIYNLIGNKDRILYELSGAMIEIIETSLSRIDEDHPLEMAEEVVFVATGCIESDPDFHRAALLAIDHLDRRADAHREFARLGRRAAAMQEKAALLARKQGFLEGRISAKLLGTQIFRNYQSASRDWVYRRIGLSEFRRIALLGVYLHLAADASPEFKQKLTDKISKLFK